MMGAGRRMKPRASPVVVGASELPGALEPLRGYERPPASARDEPAVTSRSTFLPKRGGRGRSLSRTHPGESRLSSIQEKQAQAS